MTEPKTPATLTDDVNEALRLLKNLEVGRALGRRLKELEAIVATLTAERDEARSQWMLKARLRKEDAFAHINEEIGPAAVRAGGVPQPTDLAIQGISERDTLIAQLWTIAGKFGSEECNQIRDPIHDFYRRAGGVSPPAICQHSWQFDITHAATVCRHCGEHVSDLEVLAGGVSRQAEWEPDGEESENPHRTLAILAKMLGWENTPPRRIFEQEINTLKALVRAGGVSPQRFSIEGQFFICGKCRVGHDGVRHLANREKAPDGIDSDVWAAVLDGVDRVCLIPEAGIVEGIAKSIQVLRAGGVSPDQKK